MKPVTFPPIFVRRSSKRRQFRWLPFFLILTIAMLVGVVAASACTFVLKWGTAGNLDGQFLQPRGIAVDSTGNVYAVDASGTPSQIQKFDANGNFIARIGANNDNPNGFISAYRITVDSSGNVYATDGNADRSSNLVKKFDSAGTLQFAFGTRGSSGGQFAVPGPAGVAVNSSGNIYVADPGNNRVQKFSSTGTFLAAIGSSGTGDGQFSNPIGIAIDSTDNLYVADSGNNRNSKVQ